MMLLWMLLVVVFLLGSFQRIEAETTTTSFGGTPFSPSVRMEWNDLPPLTVQIVSTGAANNDDDDPKTKGGAAPTTTETTLTLTDANIILLGYHHCATSKTSHNNQKHPTNGLTREVERWCESEPFQLTLPTWLTNEAANLSAVGDTTTPWMMNDQGQRLIAINFGNSSSSALKNTTSSDTSCNESHGENDNDTILTKMAAARKIGAILADRLPKYKHGASAVTSCLLFLPLEHQTTACVTELLTAMYAGFYKDQRYKGTGSSTAAGASNQKTEKDSNQPLHLTILVSQHSELSVEEHQKQALHQATSLAQAMTLARDIVNAPHNVLNSLSLVETAQRLVKQHRHCLTCHILDTEDCHRLGMGAFLGVARGSETPARFIHLVYQSPQRRRQRFSGRATPPLRKLALIGKGLLMDTGGYNIKTSNMEKMKFDCGGAAIVLGAARALALLEPPHVQVHILIAACENMINERAMVPGDIVTAMNGKTIEVLNTDAEGRLTLADALVYADVHLQCEEIVEFSTLTGAVLVALGEAIAGMWTESDDLAQALLQAAQTTGEEIWRMPLGKTFYGERIKSNIADLQNIGTGRTAGSIIAALFLHEFVTKGKPFAHIDVAGTVWNWKASQASGWGVKVATEWVLSRSSSAAQQ